VRKKKKEPAVPISSDCFCLWHDSTTSPGWERERREKAGETSRARVTRNHFYDRGLPCLSVGPERRLRMEKGGRRKNQAHPERRFLLRCVGDRVTTNHHDFRRGKRGGRKKRFRLSLINLTPSRPAPLHWGGGEKSSPPLHLILHFYHSNSQSLTNKGKKKKGRRGGSPRPTTEIRPISASLYFRDILLVAYHSASDRLGKKGGGKGKRHQRRQLSAVVDFRQLFPGHARSRSPGKKKKGKKKKAGRRITGRGFRKA